jgi:hypothetical protein
MEDLVKNDFTYVAIMFAMFALSVLFIRFCDKIIGPDEAAPTRRATSATDPGPGPGPGDAETTEAAA